MKLPFWGKSMENSLIMMTTTTNNTQLNCCNYSSSSSPMLSILRKLSASSSPSSSSSSSSSSSLSFSLSRPLMECCSSSSTNNWSGLMALAKQLRMYRPAGEEKDAEERSGKVVSALGFQESVTPVSYTEPQRFSPKKAAVLICLFEGDAKELRVILTKRSSNLNSHSGEVALPGGKAEEGDASDADTATREAMEEIGLDPSLVNVVTSLEPFLSKHLLRVIPVIGILKDKNEFHPKPNPAEVEAIFDAPLEMFLKDENRRSEEREWMGHNYLVHYFDYDFKGKKYLIWGLTSGILIRAASVVYKRSPDFQEQNPKLEFPKFVDDDTTMT